MLEKTWFESRYMVQTSKSPNRTPTLKYEFKNFRVLFGRMGFLRNRAPEILINVCMSTNLTYPNPDIPSVYSFIPLWGFTP